jgi:parvulin-like peptidyl-prolyl isomerase
MALALSQHLKTLTLVLGASLALSGCGAQQAGAAAIVNDTTVRHQDIVISEKDVQSVPEELNALAQGGQELKVSDALLSLILAPYVLDEAKRVGKTVSPSEARKVIAKVADPSPSTITFVQMQLAIQKLDQASKTLIVDELGKVKITVNPRYGAFDVTKIALTPISPNWIKVSAPSPAK